LTQQHAEQIVQIFKRLVEAKLTGSLSESARAYSDLDALANHVAIIQDHKVPPRPGRVTGPARARLKATPVSSPHEGLKIKVRAIATGARWVARPASTVLAYLAC
jgi:hypothetical protein